MDWDVNPVSVYSDKYERVVENKTNEPSVRPTGFGDFASSRHVPPQPPMGAQVPPKDQNSYQAGYYQPTYYSVDAHPDGSAEQSAQQASQFYAQSNSVQPEASEYTEPKTKASSFRHAPAVDSEKESSSINGLAIALALGLLLIFGLFTNLAAKQLHGVSQMQFFSVLFVVVGVVLLVVPSEQRGILQRIAGFVLCTELCLALLPFTLGLVGFAALNRLGNLSIILLFIGAILLIAAIVFSKERLFLLSACFFFVAIFVAFVDMGVFERLFAWLFSPGIGKVVSPVHMLV